jgi:hypothetical protein
MIRIDMLKNHRHTIPTLSNIWHEVLGKVWFPELEVQDIESLTYDELNHPNETTSFVALCNEIPVGVCTFKLKEEFQPDLGPWLADVVVATKHQNKVSVKCWLMLLL